MFVKLLFFSSRAYSLELFDNELNTYEYIQKYMLNKYIFCEVTKSYFLGNCNAEIAVWVCCCVSDNRLNMNCNLIGLPLCILVTKYLDIFYIPGVPYL